MKLLSSIKYFLQNLFSSPTFYSDGDWLIWRSTRLGGGFDMQLCTKLIQLEKRNLSTDDVERILSRYKEHVSYWNIPYETIQNELRIFAVAKGDKGYVLDMFEELEAKRISMKQSAK